MAGVLDTGSGTKGVAQYSKFDPIVLFDIFKGIEYRDGFRYKNLTGIWKPEMTLLRLFNQN